MKWFKDKMILGFFVSFSAIMEFLKLWMIISCLFPLSNTSLLMNQILEGPFDSFWSHKGDVKFNLQLQR